MDKGKRGKRAMEPSKLVKVCILTVLMIFGLVLPAGAAPGDTTRVSVSSDGVEGNDDSGQTYANGKPSISDDGRYIAFWSDATNLVPDDTNGNTDIFVHDLQTGSTERVSVATGGLEVHGHSFDPAISGNGRYVAFASWANDLVSGDTNGRDIFVHDRVNNTTERVSVDSDENEANAFSMDPAISDDGNFVAFVSAASNLVSGDNNYHWDIFVRDRSAGTTERVSIAAIDDYDHTAASQEPSISDDGRYVAFGSHDSTLVPDDNNGFYDIFVFDRQTDTTTLVSVSTDGTKSNQDCQDPFISGDGKYVAFVSSSTNLAAGLVVTNEKIFVRDLEAGTTEVVSVDSGGIVSTQQAFRPSISDDGQIVAFDSSGNDLVDSDSNGFRDVFVHDRDTGETTLESVSSAQAQGNGDSFNAWIASDGTRIVFVSESTDLIPNDNNDDMDVFVHELSNGDSFSHQVFIPLITK